MPIGIKHIHQVCPIAAYSNGHGIASVDVLDGVPYLIITPDVNCSLVMQLGSST